MVDNENRLIEKLKEGLDSIDKTFSAETPDISKFREMVTIVENKKQVKAKKESIIFIILASLIITFEVYSFNQSIIFFAVLQSFAFTAVIIVFLNWLKNRPKKVKIT